MEDAALKDKMLILTQKLINAQFTSEREMNESLEKLIEISPDPSISDYIFFPEENLSAEEIVIKALQYVPKPLP